MVDGNAKLPLEVLEHPASNLFGDSPAFDSILFCQDHHAATFMGYLDSMIAQNFEHDGPGNLSTIGHV